MKRLAIIAAIFFMFPQCLLAQKAAPTNGDSSFGKTQLFQIIILTGTTDGPDELKDLPKNAEKAVQDIRNFLPYKRYVVLDTALLRMTSDSGPSQTALQGKIGDLSVDFLAGMRYRERDNRYSVEHFELVKMGPKPQTILETSFGLVRGETVVVGTSRLNGEGRALIVLVTALPMS